MMKCFKVEVLLVLLVVLLLLINLSVFQEFRLPDPWCPRAGAHILGAGTGCLMQAQCFHDVDPCRPGTVQYTIALLFSTLLYSQPSQNQAVIDSLDRFLEVFDRLLSKGAIAFSCIQESLSLLFPTNNLLFKIFLRRLIHTSCLADFHSHWVSSYSVISRFSKLVIPQTPSANLTKLWKCEVTCFQRCHIFRWIDKINWMIMKPTVIYFFSDGAWIHSLHAHSLKFVAPKLRFVHPRMQWHLLDTTLIIRTCRTHLWSSPCFGWCALTSHFPSDIHRNVLWTTSAPALTKSTPLGIFSSLWLWSSFTRYCTCTAHWVGLFKAQL